MRAAASLYPWDVVGDPDGAREVAGLGVAEVSLAAAYHSVRGITPRHPGRRIVLAPEAATYYAPDPVRWAGSRLRPRPASWLGDKDSFPAALGELRGAGLAVSAWIVFLHRDVDDEPARELAVENAFGDCYPWALCPARAEVQDYAVRLASEVAQRFDVDGFELEACGWYGLDHLSAHDKVHAERLGAAGRTLASICFCPSCRRELGDGGVDPEELRKRCAAALDALLESGVEDGASPVRTAMQAILGEDLAEATLAVRLAVADRLRRQVVRAIREACRSDAVLWLDAQCEPWGYGANVGGDWSRALEDVDGICFQGGELDGALRMVGETGTAPPRLGVVVDVLADPHDPDRIPLVERARQGGVSDLRLYHAGLASLPGRRVIRELVERFGGGGR